LSSGTIATDATAASATPVFPCRLAAMPMATKLFHRVAP